MLYIQLLSGFLLLLIGGELLVRNGVAIAKYLKIPTVVIGLTIVAFGTSSPELIISISASLKDSSAIALGNVIGSNIINIAVVIGISSFIATLNIPKSIIKFDSVFLLMSSILMVIMCLSGTIDRFEGIILLSTLIGYILYMMRRIQKGQIRFDPQNIEEMSSSEDRDLSKFIIAIFLFILSIVLLALGGNMLTGAAIKIAQNFGISEATIGVTVVSLGGSMPEIVTSIIALRKQQTYLAISNIIGSNIFNTLGIIGTTATISPIVVDPSFISMDLNFMLITTLVFHLLFRISNKSNVFTGFIFMGIYALYMLMRL